MINFDCIIYCDALSLLFSDKADIKKLVIDQLAQGGECEFDQIKYHDMDDMYYDAFDSCPLDVLAGYISVEEEQVTFDYGESAACENLRCVAFNVPCLFDYDRWKKEVAEAA